MTYDCPPVYLPATPEYILEVVRDWHRQQCQFDGEADPDAALTFETTIAQWRRACDLLDWRRLGRALDQEWRLGRSDAEWRAVLEPARSRNLRQLCDFVSRNTQMPAIKPCDVLGKTCYPAGAFLAIRWMLREDGADVNGVAPSTNLDEYARRHLATFLGPISGLAPNALPEIKLSTPWYDLSVCAGGFGMLLGVGLLIAGWVGSPFFTIAGGIVFAGSCVGAWLGTWFVARCRGPEQVTFGELKTFRDLSVLVAAGSRRV
jgi:hypothetical protein